tara:strand:+ start:26668 stop:28344 length:1677 start_codon:yes stop_codon:yes gene_type:complete
MKIVLYISFIICFTCAIAQKPVVQLKVSNIQPMVGELITIQMTSNLGSVFEVKFPTAFTSREEVNGMRQEYINGRSNTVYYQTLSGFFVTSGNYILGPVYVKGRTKKVKSNKVEISVSTDKKEGELKGKKNAPQANKPPVFAQTECSSLQIYRGQSVSLKSKVYSKKEFTGIRHYEAYTIVGKHEAYELKAPKELDWLKVNLDGQAYLKLQFEEKVIFPNELGELSISPFEMILTGYGSYMVRSKANTIEVVDLPAKGQPYDFSGLVGRFEVNTTLSDSIAKTQDIVSLTIEIDGIGNLQHAMVPEIKLPKQLELYSDPIITKNYKIGVDGFKGNVIFTYPIRVLEQVSSVIEPISISYFDLDSNQYITVNGMEIVLNPSGLNDSIIEGSKKDPSEYVKSKPMGSPSIIKEESNINFLMFLGGASVLLFLFFFYRRKWKSDAINHTAYHVPKLSTVQKQIKSAVDPLIEESESLPKMEHCLFTLCSFLLSQDSLKLSRNEIYLFLSKQISQEQIDDIRSLFTSIDEKRYAQGLSQSSFTQFQLSFKERVLTILKLASN